MPNKVLSEWIFLFLFYCPAASHFATEGSDQNMSLIQHVTFRANKMPSEHL